MKAIFLTLLIPVLVIIVRRNTSFFDGLDFLKSDCGITWDDITEDLWP